MPGGPRAGLFDAGFLTEPFLGAKCVPLPPPRPPAPPFAGDALVGEPLDFPPLPQLRKCTASLSGRKVLPQFVHFSRAFSL